jgi:mannuronan synthase
VETTITSSRRSTADPLEAAKLLLLLGFTSALAVRLWDGSWPGPPGVFLQIAGWLAVWRYGWWMTHVIRSQIYRRRIFPTLRRQADSLWRMGWRPRFIHIVIVTYRERSEITARMLDSVVRECCESGAPTRIYLGVSNEEDERALRDHFAGHYATALLEVLIVRAHQPGKRNALGLALRAMKRCGAKNDDLAILMDGDSILTRGAVQRCAPLFRLCPRLGAVTTDEVAVVEGPKWIRDWYELRFAQRRLVMESHSLSRKVLTLTGRFSAFRAVNVLDESFIRMVESDSLSHWLWGRFQFLSGDDKSTWYWVLRSGQEMLYVPDVVILTIEHIEGSALERAKQNLLRWSGNMLRNSTRALALGPRRCGLYIWWCLVDQRLSIWTTLVGPVGALGLSLVFGPAILAAYFVWIVATRLCVSLVLWHYGASFSASFPLLLYGSQIANAGIKLFLTFRIARQSWTNRGNQHLATANGNLRVFRNAMAAWMTLLYLGLFVFFLSVQLGLLELR